MYESDPSDWKDKLCDAAPPYPDYARRIMKSRASQLPDAPTRARDNLLSRLRRLEGQWTAAEAAVQLDCSVSSINDTLRENPALFVKLTETTRHRDGGALWCVRE
jgi:hypothetical protein